MKIWIDITNSPHVAFFKPFIKSWEAMGHTVAITTRNYSNTIQLLNAEKFSFSIVGGHAGGSRIQKLFNFPIRVYSLVVWLNKVKPSVGISQSSFYSPMAGWLCGIRTIYTNDNEHAKGNLLAFMFASRVLLPEPLKDLRTRSFPFYSKKIQFYSGIKEGLYLKAFSLPKPIRSTTESITVYFRPDPWEAEYYKTDKAFLEETISILSEKVDVVILPRSVHQYEYFKLKFTPRVKVVKGVLSLNEIFTKADIFIGAGGSMSRELAMLGIPTISIYRGKLLAVDRFLIELGILYHKEISDLREILSFQDLHNSQAVRRELLAKGESAFDEFNSVLFSIVKDKLNE